MTIPTLSIGLPVYNGENFLVPALDSILNQDFQDFELIISDNASDDATSAICRRYAEQDKRIRYHRFDVNQGGVRNFNHVFELASGKYFKWAAHDDICLPGFFRRCIETFERAPSSVVLVYPKTQMIDEAGRPLTWHTESLEFRHPRPHRRLAHALRTFNVLSAQFGLIRSDVLRKTRLFDKIIGADFVLLAELAMLGEFREVPETLFQRRMHPGISTRVNRSWSQLLNWCDPSLTTYVPRVSPMMRLGYEYVRSIERLPLRPVDRWLCYLTVPAVWYLRECRNWSGRQRMRLFRSARIWATKVAKVSR